MTAATTVIVERTFVAPPSRVWSAWTDVDLLTKWWGCATDMLWNVHTWDVRVGGEIHVKLDYDGEPYEVRGRFLTVDDERRLQYEWEAGQVITVSVAPQGNRSSDEGRARWSAHGRDARDRDRWLDGERRADPGGAGVSEPEAFRHEVSERIRSIALALPQTTEGSSCVNRAFKAGGKNFAFLGERDDGCGLRLKLGPSLGDVRARSERDPAGFEVGTNGWTMLRFAAHDHPPDDDLERWIVESFRLLAPKRVAAALDA